ncbi:MAG: metallophosphoesterase [Actinomycetota bacterium]|nr:metallophosphoesterase [Actinomycetota bacterium]
MRLVRTALVVGAGLGAYSLMEPHRLRLVERCAEVAPGCPPLAILHLSDTHMTGRTSHLKSWLQALAARLGSSVDLVLLTGDMIDENRGIPVVLEALEPFKARLGRFYVLGSHDLFVSSHQGYLKYLNASAPAPPPLKTKIEELESGLREQGWLALTNRTEFLDTPGGRVRLAGVDDPYLGRHKTSHIVRAKDEAAAIALVHAPDVVSEWALNGFDLILGGHTHGGQLRLPGWGSLVTNCRLPNALSQGLHRVGHTWLHVSPGLGQSRFSPIRFWCRPEATLLRLVPAAPRAECRS